jgi:hypothetical protein
VKIGELQLERVEKNKYLGVILNEGLKINENLYFICKKMGKKYGFMCRANKKLTTESKIFIYIQFNCCASNRILQHLTLYNERRTNKKIAENTK